MSNLTLSNNTIVLHNVTSLPFTAEDYVPPESVNRFADTPRGGRNANLTLVLEDIDGNLEEYIWGLIYFGAIVLVCFVVWSLILVLLMCCRKRAGFLSGRAFHVVEEEYENNSDEERSGKVDDDDLKKTMKEKPKHFHHDKLRTRAGFVRFVFLICAGMVISGGVLLVTRGLSSLQLTTNTVTRDVTETSILVEEAQSVLVSVEDLNQRSQVILETIIEEMGERSDFCPRSDVLTDFNEIEDIRLQFLEIADVLEELNSFVEGNTFGDIQSVLKDVHVGSERVVQETESINFLGWGALVFLIPFTVFPTIMTSTAILSYVDIHMPFLQRCFVPGFVIPIFAIMTVVAYLVASLMLIAGGVCADFCISGGGEEEPSPDAHILQAIQEAGGYARDSFAFRVSEFYISQCQTVDPFQEVVDVRTELAGSLEMVVTISRELEANPELLDPLALLCGREFTFIEQLAVQLDGVLQGAILLLTTTLSVVSCSRIVPIYNSAVHNGICRVVPDAVFWLFNTSLALAFFGMMMLTLRAAYKPTVVVHPEHNDNDDDGTSQNLRKTPTNPDTTPEGLDTVLEVRMDEDLVAQEAPVKVETAADGDSAESPALVESGTEEEAHGKDDTTAVLNVLDDIPKHNLSQVAPGEEEIQFQAAEDKEG